MRKKEKSALVRKVLYLAKRNLTGIAIVEISK
jgi:hypothetical protein